MNFPPCHLSRSCRCHYTLKRSVVFFTARVCALQPHYHFTKTSARLVSAVTLSRDEASKCKYKQRRPSHRVIEAFYVHPHCGKIFLSFYSSFVACFYSFDMKLTKCLVKKYFCKKRIASADKLAAFTIVCLHPLTLMVETGHNISKYLYI